MDGSFFRLRMQLPSFRPILDLCMFPVQKRSDGVDWLDLLGRATFYASVETKMAWSYTNDIPMTRWLHERLQQAVQSTFQNVGLICESLIVTETSDHTWNHEILNISILLPCKWDNFTWGQHRSTSWFSFPQFQPILGRYWIYVMWISAQSTQQHRFC